MVSHDDRLIELELMLTHLQRQYDDLNEVVLDQGKQLAEQRKRINELESDMQSGMETVEQSLPPHLFRNRS